jgi:myo-inositol 2-dehydrogenase/D-chiro-inositol 1-dehydrogenase
VVPQVDVSRLRLAFVGCGAHARTLMETTPNIPEIDLVAVCDVQAELARSAARRFGALTSYTDFEEMLAVERPDAVAVVGPPTMGIQIGSAVLDAGCHLYVEKPLARNSREAAPLVEAARRSSKHTQVGFNQRHAQLMRHGKGLVDAPEFGTPTYIESRHWQSGQIHPVWGIADEQYAWLILNGIHAVDMLRYVFGEVDEVHTFTSRAADSGSLVSVCRFRNGANGVLNLHSSTGGNDQMFEAVGTGRTVRVSGFDDLTYHNQERWAPSLLDGPQGSFVRLPHSVNRGDRMGYAAELRDFATALLAGEPPFPSIADAFESTRLAEAVYASAQLGRPVRVAEAPVIEV